MAEDLFQRFKTGAPAVPPPATGKKDDGSGLAWRGVPAGANHVPEAEVLAAIERIPSMPTVVQALLARFGKENTNSTDLEDLIRQDMVIAGRLLKLVNSPFYGLGREVSSLAQSVQIVGFSSLRCLVLAAGLTNLLAVDLSCYGFADKGLWKNSMATAALAKAIATRNGASEDEQESYFVAGLLRDVGFLVLGPLMSARNLQLRAAKEGETDLLRRERAMIGHDHCWVNERVAEKWSLPQGLRVCLMHHHRIPPSATPSELKQLAALRLSERLVYAAGVGVLKDHPFETRLDAVLIQASGLDAHRFEDLMKEVPKLVQMADMAF